MSDRFKKGDRIGRLTIVRRTLDKLYTYTNGRQFFQRYVCACDCGRNAVRTVLYFNNCSCKGKPPMCDYCALRTRRKRRFDNPKPVAEEINQSTNDVIKLWKPPGR